MSHRRRARREGASKVILVIAMLSLLWMVARALGVPSPVSEGWEVGGVGAVYVAALAAVCDVAWRSTRD